MKLSTQPYKGARDFYPEDMRLQKYMFAVWRSVAERFGYEEYTAPLLEPIELYKAKSSDEIVSEQTYYFTDRGGREVVIRPEMTPTVSRMVAAKRQELPYPLRWYSIPNLWRYERPQRGRLREHWQLNVDIFGQPGIEAEHEIILVADSIMKEFGASKDMYKIQLNSRKLIDNILSNYLGADNVQRQTLVRLIDRMQKMPYPEFVGEVDAIFTPSQREAGASEKLLDVLKAKSMADLPEAIKNGVAAKELKQLLEMLQEAGLTNAVFDITIMRGFDYYTDIVFEMVDTDAQNNRALFGGGRYDGLVGQFGVEPVPTVGFGWGDVTLANFLETHGLLPKLPPTTEVYLVLLGDSYTESQKLLRTLREEGVTVAVDCLGRKPGVAIKTALKLGVPYVLFVGEKEIETNLYNLKKLSTGEEQTLSPERIVSTVLDERTNAGSQ